MPAKIRQLKCDEVLPWELEFAGEEAATGGEGAASVSAEKKMVSVVNIVRALVVGRTKYCGMIAAAYNAGDVDCFKQAQQEGVDKDSPNKDRGRPPGWCMPGGKVKSGETPRQALLEHEAGELIWGIVGDPIDLLTVEKRYSDRIERTHYFLVYVNEEATIEITADEGREVSTTQFFPIDTILNSIRDNRIVEMDQQRACYDPRPWENKFYFSHVKQHFSVALKRYLEMQAAGEIEQ